MELAENRVIVSTDIGPVVVLKSPHKKEWLIAFPWRHTRNKICAGPKGMRKFVRDRVAERLGEDK